MKQTKEERSGQGWAGLQNRDLKRESLIVTVQNQSKRTNLVKAKIDKSQGDALCRVCRKADEIIDHIVCVSSIMIIIIIIVIIMTTIVIINKKKKIK